MNLLKRLIGSGSEGGSDLGRRENLSTFRREMERAFDRAWSELERNPFEAAIDGPAWPAIDVAEDDKSVTLRVDVPGMAPKDVDVEVSGNQLTVRGQREEKRETKNGGAQRQERYLGSFYRTVTLPSYTDTAKTEAKYDKGVLTVIVPKVPGQGPKHVEVKA